MVVSALDLDPAGYGGTYKLVGGRSSLDLVNTVSWPETSREHDWLSSPSNLDRWCDAIGLSPGPTATVEHLRAARRIRDDLAATLRPLTSGHPPTPDAIKRLNNHLSSVARRRSVHPTTLQWTWGPNQSATDRLAAVVFDAAEIVTASSHDRLRHCESCDWLFEDQSRNGKRRWCHMADCGSREKSRRYYHRNQAKSS
jgi:predicted RNA-binding Zn ribbon-like protein